MDYMSFTQLVYASCHSQESLVYLSGIPTVTLVAIDWTRRTFREFMVLCWRGV